MTQDGEWTMTDGATLTSGVPTVTSTRLPTGSAGPATSSAAPASGADDASAAGSGLPFHENGGAVGLRIQAPGTNPGRLQRQQLVVTMMAESLKAGHEWPQILRHLQQRGLGAEYSEAETNQMLAMARRMSLGNQQGSLS